MKRLHVHVSVSNLQKSIGFYSALFQAEPTVNKPDYAKWMLEDPRVNFAISEKGDRKPGLNHLGVQAEEDGELEALYAALGAANISTHDETCAKCCYAESDKHWATDPDGLVWETFRSMRQIAVYGDDRAEALDLLATPEAEAEAKACCGATA
ncbi:ArsI/CadI family heavy metal resistance metalloenzyme [Caulobacter sp. 17J80-11]|uniref:ArsI/CadI family heavy metal resistance metalloenzyme n=1 Tax=Caulobacter sp. 17J80-11 TaxID=2763502 RepID=UPI001653DDB8|nr:ArsI/CadI family heavy metal resistance metalloenzyme [Caulobacter sp. 17J80-11]MBC6981256.1 glyoxalase/bleomycin resistance/dioxygenase family protein [Caulobacter sp. 17J80-11]